MLRLSTLPKLGLSMRCMNPWMKAVPQFQSEVPEEAPATSLAEDTACRRAAEFEPEEASASYRIDRSAPSEFRFASASERSAEPELTELAPEAAEPAKHPRFEPTEVARTKTIIAILWTLSALPVPGIAELDGDFRRRGS